MYLQCVTQIVACLWGIPNKLVANKKPPYGGFEWGWRMTWLFWRIVWAVAVYSFYTGLLWIGALHRFNYINVFKKIINFRQL